MEQTGTRPEGERRLVLGFDGGCFTCSELAKRIQEQTVDRLEVRSLRDPQVEHWREQALGKNAPWAPTLIEVEGSRVKAWTGLRMGVALSCRLGPAATWRVMQTLGDIYGTAQPTESPTDALTFGMSRGRFLKGLGGTAVAFGVLTGAGNFAAMAFARSASPDGALEALKSVKTTDLAGKELVDAARRAAQHRDVVNLMGRTWSAGVRDGRAAAASEEGEQAIQMQGGTSTTTADRTTPEATRIAFKAARHELKNGATMLAVAYKLPRDSKVLVYHESDRLIPDGEGEFESRAMLYRIEDEEAVLESDSIDGGREVTGSDKAVSTRLYCGGCDSSRCSYRGRTCESIKYGCLAVMCAVCIPACGSLLGCLYCAVVQCPYAYFATCCRRVGHRCVHCRYCV